MLLNIRKIIQVLDDNLESILIIILYTYFVIIIILQVFLRYVANMPLQWAEETARYTFIYMVYFAASLAVKHDDHLRIDILYKYMRQKQVILAKIFSDICLLVLVGYVIYYSIIIIEFQISMGTSIMSLRGVNLAFAYFAIPLGYSLMAIRAISKIIDRVSLFRQMTTK